VPRIFGFDLSLMNPHELVLLLAEFLTHKLHVGHTPLSHEELLLEDDEKEENCFSGLAAPHFGQEISSSLESMLRSNSNFAPHFRHLYS